MSEIGTIMAFRQKNVFLYPKPNSRIMKQFNCLPVMAAVLLLALPSCRKSSELSIDTANSLASVSISFAEESISLLVGGSSYNSATVTDDSGNVLSLSLNYSSSDAGCVYVDKTTGTVRGLTAGTATVTAYTTATDTYAAASASYKVTVSEEDGSHKSVSLSFDYESLNLDLAGAKYASSTLNPAAAFDSDGNEIEGISVSYESLNTAYATVSSSGLVTGVAVGTTYIYATTAQTTIGGITYAAATASYKVKVVDSSSSDDTDDEIDPANTADEVANFDPDYKIKVTFSSSSASVALEDASGNAVDAIDGVTVSTSGAGLTVTNASDYCIHYVLSGSSSNGFFKLYSSRKQEIELSSLTLGNTDGAAINNQSGKRTFVVLTGESRLSDGGTYSSTPDGEDERAAFFSEGQLCISGSGSLTVTATGKAGIASDDYLRFLGGTVKVSSTAGHGMRGKDAVIVSAGSVSVTVSADGKKGISTDGFYQQDGGEVTVTTTGNAVYDSSDGDLAGVAGVKCDTYFNMNAGNLTATVSGAGGKGINIGGVATFTGGTINATASGKNRFYKSSKYTDTVSYSDSDKNNYPHSFAKAIKCDGSIYVQGSAYVYGKSSSHEGITTDGTWNQTGGVVIAEAYDDAVNSAGSLSVSGGYIRGTSTNNDGIDANNSITVSGGVMIGEGASAPECGIDSVEGTYVTVNGGYVISRGGSLNAFTTTSAKAFVQTTVASGAKIGVCSGSTQLVAYQAPSSGGTTTLICAPEMVSGSSYTLYTGVSGITLTDSDFPRFGTSFSGGSAGSSLTASSSAGNGGMGGGGGPGGGGYHGR